MTFLCSCQLYLHSLKKTLVSYNLVKRLKMHVI